MLQRLFVRLARAAERRAWTPLTPFASAAWVAAIRTLAERYTALAGRNEPRNPVHWFLHVFAFYVALHFCITALVARATPVDWRKASNLVAMGLLIGVVPPFVDVAIYGPGAFAYDYGSGFAGFPWLLSRPPFPLPPGETLVLWGSVAFVGAYGLLRASSALRRVVLVVGQYALIVLFLGGLGAAIEAVRAALPELAPTQVRVPLLVFAGVAGAIAAGGAGGRLLARLPHALLAPLFVLLGASLHGGIADAAWWAAALFLLAGASFALANDWYDRREDALQGRPLTVDGDLARVLTLLPLLTAAFALSVRFEVGLALVAFAVVSHAYHADPMRLKCVFPLSYKTEGMLAGVAFVAGAGADQTREPASWMLLAALAVALGVPGALVFKDLKDVESDRSAGVRTLFVVAAERGWPAGRAFTLALALLVTCLGVLAAFVVARAGPGPGAVATVVLAAASPLMLLALRGAPAKAVLSAMVLAEGAIAAGAAALASGPPAP